MTLLSLLTHIYHMVLSLLHTSCSQLATMCSVHVFPMSTLPSSFAWQPPWHCLQPGFLQQQMLSWTLVWFCSFLPGICHLSWDGRDTSPPCTSGHLLLSQKTSERNMKGRKKNLCFSSPSQLSLHALQSRMMSGVPCKVQDE